MPTELFSIPLNNSNNLPTRILIILNNIIHQFFQSLADLHLKSPTAIPPLPASRFPLPPTAPPTPRRFPRPTPPPATASPPPHRHSWPYSAVPRPQSAPETPNSRSLSDLCGYCCCWSIVYPSEVDRFLWAGSERREGGDPGIKALLPGKRKRRDLGSLKGLGSLDRIGARNLGYLSSQFLI